MALLFSVFAVVVYWQVSDGWLCLRAIVVSGSSRKRVDIVLT